MKIAIAAIILLSILSINAYSKSVCIDTDVKYSNQETKRGYVQTLDSIFWDDCDGEILIEQYCHNDQPKTREVNCEKGCNRGACSKYSLFSVPKFQLPSITKLGNFFNRVNMNEKKVSGYELNGMEVKNLNSALRDIDKRLSIIEASLPEQSIFPIIIDSNGKHLKAVYANDEIFLVESRGTIAELVTNAQFTDSELSLKEFYGLISESESRPVTKKGRALILEASS